MLGETLKDPMGVEAGGEIKGMGLLPVDTVFAGDKTRTRVEGSFEGISGILEELSGVPLEGYEIHMGVSTLREEAKPVTRIRNYACGEQEQKLDGAYVGNVYGTYVHGVFDREEVAKGVVRALAKEKGLDVSGITAVDFQAFKESQYDKLAAGLREHLDLERIYRILDAGIE